MKSLYLIGFMGSGKTSIAERLHQKLGWEVEDTDQLIEEWYQTTIPTIFKEKGELVFRQYETTVLLKTTRKNTIISTGGGIIEKESNREWLKEQGNVVFLSASWEEINQRLIHDQNRPIWNNQDRDKKKLLADRLPLYREIADIVVETDGKTEHEIAEEIMNRLFV
ncbi:shikimate kinase [Gracilibacillus phocaeensis]|nr:shikimate kinase [Gracilibacillus phocaeensis]